MPSPPGSLISVDLAGYFTATSGLTVAAENIRTALEAAGVGVTPVAIPFRGAPDPPPPVGDPASTATIVCVSPDGMRGAREALGALAEGRRVIGFWWWEVPAFPARWQRPFDGVDEIWVGSRFIADLLAPIAPVPVVRMPFPVPEPGPAAVTRADLGLPEGFLFGTLLDYGSVVARKNPEGAIEAFRRAFAASDRDVALVIKTMGGDRHPAEHARVLAAAAADDRVRVIDARMAPERKDALLAALDCFVSLHRSEGFGLVIAEAMLLGTPVLATDQGGARELMSALNAFPVDHRPVAVGPGREPYPAQAEWAEPELDHAAALMRSVRADPGQARSRATRAREDVLREHAPAAAGRAMAARLGRAPEAPAAGPAEALDLRDLEAVLRRGAEASVPRRSGARTALRQALLRLLRPYSAHQRMVDEEIVRALRTLDDRARSAIAGQQALAARMHVREAAEADDERVSPSSPHDV
jgi:hypothetical protein